MPRSPSAEEILERKPPSPDASIEDQNRWHWLSYWAIRQQALEAKKYSEALAAQREMRAMTVTPRIPKQVDMLEGADQVLPPVVDEEAQKILEHFQNTPYRVKDKDDEA